MSHCKYNVEKIIVRTQLVDKSLSLECRVDNFEIVYSLVYRNQRL